MQSNREMENYQGELENSQGRKRVKNPMTISGRKGINCYLMSAVEGLLWTLTLTGTGVPLRDSFG